MYRRRKPPRHMRAKCVVKVGANPSTNTVIRVGLGMQAVEVLNAEKECREARVTELAFPHVANVRTITTSCPPGPPKPFTCVSRFDKETGRIVLLQWEGRRIKREHVPQEPAPQNRQGVRRTRITPSRLGYVTVNVRRSCYAISAEEKDMRRKGTTSTQHRGKQPLFTIRHEKGSA